MLWFTVWTLLVVGALVTFFLLGRDLWRKAKRLAREAGRAAEVLDRLEEQIALAEQTLPLTTPAPVELSDAGPARERLELLRAAAGRRRERRQARHELAYARWRSFSH